MERFHSEAVVIRDLHGAAFSERPTDRAVVVVVVI
jgi:hypothetical protein